MIRSHWDGSFDARWTPEQLADAIELANLWERCPPLALPPLVARVFYTLEYTARYRPFTNQTLWEQSQVLRRRMAAIAVATFPNVWLPLDAIAHIPTRTFPESLASVIAGWEITRNLPIYFMDTADGLELLNGNHRLTAARAKGAASILAMIAPPCPEYRAGRDREEAVIAEIRALDSIPIWVDQDNNLRNSLR